MSLARSASIDELIVSTTDEMVELTNGCICCSINDELLQTVYKVSSALSHRTISWLRPPGLPIPRLWR